MILYNIAVFVLSRQYYALLSNDAASAPVGTDFAHTKSVKALETQGKLHELASPRAATQNNRTVLVKVARREVCFGCEIGTAVNNVLGSF